MHRPTVYLHEGATPKTAQHDQGRYYAGDPMYQPTQQQQPSPQMVNPSSANGYGYGAALPQSSVRPPPYNYSTPQQAPSPGGYNSAAAKTPSPMHSQLNGMAPSYPSYPTAYTPPGASYPPSTPTASNREGNLHTQGRPPAAAATAPPTAMSGIANPSNYPPHTTTTSYSPHTATNFPPHTAATTNYQPLLKHDYTYQKPPLAGGFSPAGSGAPPGNTGAYQYPHLTTSQAGKQREGGGVELSTQPASHQPPPRYPQAYPAYTQESLAGKALSSVRPGALGNTPSSSRNAEIPYVSTMQRRGEGGYDMAGGSSLQPHHAGGLGGTSHRYPPQGYDQSLASGGYQRHGDYGVGGGPPVPDARAGTGRYMGDAHMGGLQQVEAASSLAGGGMLSTPHPQDGLGGRLPRGGPSLEGGIADGSQAGGAQKSATPLASQRNWTTRPPGYPSPNPVGQSANMEDLTRPMYGYARQASPPGHIDAHYEARNSVGSPLISGYRGRPMYGAPSYPATAVAQEGIKSSYNNQASKQSMNAPSYFVRPTCTKFPNSTRVLQKAHIPIGFVFQPLAEVPEGYPEVPTVNFGPGGLARCSLCRAFINPFATWESSGRRWMCNFCATLNDCPAEYTRTYQPQSSDVDPLERIELVCGSVDIIASQEYLRRQPAFPVYMFLIDVSSHSVNSGLVDVVCGSIKHAIRSGKIPGDSRTRIGIATFDSTVHFYGISNDGATHQMLVMPDLESVFLPLANDIVVYLQDSLEALVRLLDSIPKMWKATSVNESCMGSAMQAAQLAMCNTGGKLCVFFATPPTLGSMALSLTRPKKSNAKSQEEAIMNFLHPLNDAYKVFADTSCNRRIAVHLFACPANLSVDLATMYPLAKETAGELHYYPQFNAHQHGRELESEIFNVLTCPASWDAVSRFRVSRGWMVSKWYGHFSLHKPDLLVLPNTHPSRSYSVLLQIDETVVQEKHMNVYIQSSLLYTTSEGDRRIRVHTFCLPVTQNYADVCSSMDPQAIASILAQEAIEKCLTGTLADARLMLEERCSQIVTTHGLPLSPSAKALPLYILGLLKSPAIRSFSAVSADARIFFWSRLVSSSLDHQIAFMYPRMFALHDLDEQVGKIDESGSIIMPPRLNLTRDLIRTYGCYLLENGESILIWIGRGISTEWLNSVFGVSSIDYIHPDYAKAYIGNSGTSQGLSVSTIMQEVCRQRKAPHMKVSILREQDEQESRFFLALVEDASNSMRLSYREYLQILEARAGARPSTTH